MIANTLSNEVFFGVLKSELGSDSWRTELMTYMNNEPEISRRVVRQVVANWLEHMDKSPISRPPLSSTPLPLFKTGRAGQRLSWEEIDGFVQHAIAAQLLLVNHVDIERAVLSESARQATLTVALAAQVHRRRNGTYPESLDLLVESGILDRVPSDPFARPETPVRYRIAPGGFTVWSIGLDLQDDGGVFNAHRIETGDIGYAVH